MLLNLALYKLGDMSDQVRKHAINLVHWMSLRFFRTQQATARLAKVPSFYCEVHLRYLSLSLYLSLVLIACV